MMNRLIAIGVLWTMMTGWAFADETGWYANLGAGVSFAQRTTGNGTWYQEGLPYHFGLQRMTYKVGVGYRFDPHWAMEVNYVPIRTGSDLWAINDDDYDVMKNACVQGTPNCLAQRMGVVDRMHLGEVVGVYRWHWGAWSPFVKGGGFAGVHRVDYYVQQATLARGHYQGYVGGLVGGVGVCYQWVCGSGTWYQGLGSSQYPIARNAFVPMLEVKVPF